jgi:hypothetical protein
MREMSERRPLLASLRDTVQFFKERKTIGRMKTEHSIFIPSSLMLQQADETEEFVKAARHINKQKNWFCPVLAEKVSVGKISGVEFVFQFNPDTDFEAIIQDIETRLK